MERCKGWWRVAIEEERLYNCEWERNRERERGERRVGEREKEGVERETKISRSVIIFARLIYCYYQVVNLMVWFILKLLNSMGKCDYIILMIHIFAFSFIFFSVVVFSFSETNLKVRQALPETAEMDKNENLLGEFTGISY